MLSNVAFSLDLQRHQVLKKSSSKNGGSSLSGVVTLTNGNSGDDSLRALGLPQVLGHQVPTHRKTDHDELRGRVALGQLGNHPVKVGGVAWKYFM